MATRVYRHIYKDMIKQNLAWLENQGPSLECSHIKQIVKDSVAQYDMRDELDQVKAELARLKVEMWTYRCEMEGLREAARLPEVALPIIEGWYWHSGWRGRCWLAGAGWMRRVMRMCWRKLRMDDECFVCVYSNLSTEARGCVNEDLRTAVEYDDWDTWCVLCMDLWDRYVATCCTYSETVVDFARTKYQGRVSQVWSRRHVIGRSNLFAYMTQGAKLSIYHAWRSERSRGLRELRWALDQHHDVPMTRSGPVRLPREIQKQPVWGHD